MSKTGYLEMIIGPMFSGKTSRILEIYRKETYCKSKVYVINHSIDKRYGESNELINHNQEKIPCQSYTLISDFINVINKENNISNKNSNSQNTVVLVNEGQFFDDIKKGIISLVEDYKFDVYVCGLDGDFKRDTFGDFLTLIPYCDKVVKLKALCYECRNGKYAPFSHRVIKDNSEQIKVGSIETYIPLCRKCYIKYN